MAEDMVVVQTVFWVIGVQVALTPFASRRRPSETFTVGHAGMVGPMGFDDSQAPQSPGNEAQGQQAEPQA